VAGAGEARDPASVPAGVRGPAVVRRCRGARGRKGGTTGAAAPRDFTATMALTATGDFTATEDSTATEVGEVP
jgi:hypothetical protein